MYGKHFAQTYTGSMYGAGPVVFAVWGYVIANTRRDGTVELNANMLASTLGASTEDTEKAIAVLTGPDPKSRSKAHDGRRLLPLGEFLYEVPSHKRFNSMRNDDERRAYNRTKQQEHRAKKKAVKSSVKNGQPPSAHIPVDVSVSLDVDKRTTTTAKNTTSPKPAASGVSWLGAVAVAYEQAKGQGSFPHAKAGKLLKPLHEAGHSGDEIAQRLGRYLQWLDDPKFFSFQRFRETFGDYAEEHPAHLRALGGYPKLVDEFGCLTEYGERVTRPPNLKLA